MLPSIMDVATQHGLEINERSTRSEKDVRFRCPFCQSDAAKKGKYYLSLNIRDNVFKCWHCGEAGGVLKFIALLENISIEEVKRKLWNGKGPQPSLHPAEKLTPSQLKAIGFSGKNWGKAKKEDPKRYKNTLNWVWEEWQNHVKQLKRIAYMFLLDSCISSEETISAIHGYATEIGMDSADLMLELTTIKFAGDKKPAWAKSAEEWVDMARTA